MSVARTWLARLVDVEPGETRALLWSAVMFFCVLSGYFVLRPVRETWGLEYGDYYRLLWTGTAFGTLLVTPLFGWLASRLRRRTLLPVVYGIGIACVLGFWVAQLATAAEPVPAIGYAFYIWLSVFNVFATSVFWVFMVDVWTRAQSRRLFGFIAVGGTLGALAGGQIVTHLNAPLGTVNLLPISAILFVLAIACFARLSAIFGDEPATMPHLKSSGIGWSDAVAGIRLFAQNRYLLWIGAYIAAQTLVATVLYIESRVAVGEFFPTRGADITDAIANANRDARTAFFTDIDRAFNVLALVVQLFLTGRLVRWIGIGAMLALLPLINFGGFAVLAFAPSVVAYGAFEVLQRGSKFAVMKPARDMLFSVLSREEKYKAKQFLDTAIYRSSDAVWVWLQHLTRTLFDGLDIKVVVVLPACVGWAGVGHWLGREERRRASLDDGGEIRSQLVRPEADLE